MSLVGLIPARGGSKGLPGKNKRLLGGIPLIAHTIRNSIECGCLDKVVVSTDDIEIAEIAKEFGAEVPFMRPEGLATDEAPTIGVAEHLLEKLPGTKGIVLLQPTSPLRASRDIQNVIDIAAKGEHQSVVSVCLSKASPEWMYRVCERGKLEVLSKREKRNPSRRQDLEATVIPNGAIYYAQREWLLKNRSFIGEESVAYMMPKERSVDIDDLYDFMLAELMLGLNI